MFAVAAAALAYAPVASAANVWHTSRITLIYPLPDGTIILAFAEDAPTCQNPASPKYHVLGAGLNGVTADAQKNMYSAALTAFSTGAAVSVYFDELSASCTINRLYIRI